MSFESENRSGQMRIVSRKSFSIAILATAGWLITAGAWAHRDRGPDDPCRRQIGASLLHLTLYQPQFDPAGEYCEEAPRGGKTVMVVDVTAGELRQTPIGIEVVAPGDSGQPRTILSVPPKIYERGVLDTEVNLNAGSDYIVRVVVEPGADRGAQLLSFPIRVAVWYRVLVMPALIVTALLALTAVSVIRYYVSSRQDESLAAMNAHRIAD